jgi:cystathionine beta-lyase
MVRGEIEPSRVDAFLDDLRLFKLGYSWGGPVSLVVPYALKDMRQAWPNHLQPGVLVRFSLGLESPEALIEDLQRSAQRHLA